MRRGRRERRVLMIVENNPVPSDRRVWQEATALRDAGYRVTVLCPRHPRAPKFKEIIEGVRVIRHPRIVEASSSWQYVVEYGNALFWQFVVSLAVIVFAGANVVHIANPPDAVFVLSPLLRLLGARVIFDQHDPSPEIYETKFQRRGWPWRMLLALERWSCHAADVVITPNESMKRLVISRGGRKPDDIFVVRNGPDLDRFPETITTTEQRGARHTVCYMGIIGEQEGLDSYLRVIDDIVHGAGRRDIEFLIVGDGTGLAPLRRMAELQGLSPYMRFTGFLSGDELFATVGSADVCVVPEPATSLTEHTTLVKAMEYMALGRAVVQYELEEARETSGDTALYAQPNDEADLAEKIMWLLDHPEARAEMGARAARRVQEHLAWEHQIPSLLDAYDAVLGGSRK